MSPRNRKTRAQYSRSQPRAPNPILLPAGQRHSQKAPNIDSRENRNPGEANEVPEHGRALAGNFVAGCNPEQNKPDEHMKPMNTRKGEKSGPEQTLAHGDTAAQEPQIFIDLASQKSYTKYH